VPACKATCGPYSRWFFALSFSISSQICELLYVWAAAPIFCRDEFGRRGCSSSLGDLAATVEGDMREGATEVVQGDITKQKMDAIVNAANTSLLGGGGVDGAIHRAAGPELVAECRTLGGCPTGEAKITRGYRLPARWVIHTVGPVWQGGKRREDELLARCYRRSLEVAVSNGVRSVAFPAISAGIYGFPLERATRIAVGEVRAFLEKNPAVEKVIFVCFDRHTYDCCTRVLAEIS
jgi:O-acetyl-ADP-ribose deacetylase (regulator of RNase III)